MPAAIPGRVPPLRRTVEVPADVYAAAHKRAYNVERRYITPVVAEILLAYAAAPPTPDPIVRERTPFPGPKHKMSVRIPDDVWNPAAKKAAKNRDSLAEVIARGLAAYAT